MSYAWTSNAYEAGNSEMDLKNVPLNKVTIEVKEENKALIESLRKDLADTTRKAREADGAKKYWVQRFTDEQKFARELQAKLAKVEQEKAAGGGHRYVRMVKHLADRKRQLERIKADAAREMAWEEGLGADERLNEIEAALGAAGVR
ncbi:hypothetical protein AB8O64_29990 [Streptomyces sp. QH1-20]|uniref:hypothetical protein n=1 Tax=Streptomyces sp. QH1-20 TaxID=3240934 RepID=UPI00351584D7